MASTPPPLPSSSEDSDFDDDDFGCFSSAPVKATNNVLQNFVKKNNSSVKVNESVDGGLTETADTTSLKAEDGSDNVVCVKDDFEHTKPKEEQLSTDLFASDKFDEAIPSEPSPDLTKECNLDEQQNSDCSEIKDSVESKETKTVDQIEDEKCIEENDLQDRNETDEHSIVEDADKSAEFSEKDNSSVVDSKSSINEVSDDSDNNFNHAQSDATHPAELPCASKDEDEDFGDWSDMQTFQSEGVLDNEKSEAQNECLDNEEIASNNNSEEIQDDIATEKENDNSDSPHPSLSPRNDSPNIPLESDKTSEEAGCDQYSVLPDNNENDDDDGFGDFADFSSHQAHNNEEETVLPLSFKTSASDDKDEEGRSDDGNNDISDTRTMDLNNATEKSNSSVEISGLNDAEDDDDFDDDWGFKSAETNNKDDASDDFGNFGSANDGNEDSDWASFNETAQGGAANDDNDDDFNDFSENDFQASPLPPSESISSKVQESASKVEKVVSMCFPEDVSQVNQTYASQNQTNDSDSNKTDAEVNEIDNLSSVVEMGLKVTPKAKEETWTIVKELRNKNPMVGTWGRLKDVNLSHALDYGWNSSHCCQEIFSTLHIDTKNVLFSQKKQAVPFYASGLGILEPIRGGSNPADKNQPPVAPTPTLLDTTSKPDDVKKSLDIPPVDFDWGSSGLTNPLKVFKNDSFNNGLSSLEPFSDVLHKNIEPTKELSSEAKSILSKIPNLNFMRSNVLMFPIKD